MNALSQPDPSKSETVAVPPELQAIADWAEKTGVSLSELLGVLEDGDLLEKITANRQAEQADRCLAKGLQELDEFVFVPSGTLEQRIGKMIGKGLNPGDSQQFREWHKTQGLVNCRLSLQKILTMAENGRVIVNRVRVTAAIHQENNCMLLVTDERNGIEMILIGVKDEKSLAIRLPVDNSGEPILAK